MPGTGSVVLPRVPPVNRLLGSYSLDAQAEHGANGGCFSILEEGKTKP